MLGEASEAGGRVQPATVAFRTSICLSLSSQVWELQVNAVSMESRTRIAACGPAAHHLAGSRYFGLVHSIRHPIHTTVRGSPEHQGKRLHTHINVIAAGDLCSTSQQTS